MWWMNEQSNEQMSKLFIPSLSEINHTVFHEQDVMIDIVSHLFRWHFRSRRPHSCCTQAWSLPLPPNCWRWSAAFLQPPALFSTCRASAVVAAEILIGQSLRNHCAACSQPSPVWSVSLPVPGQGLSQGLNQEALWVQGEGLAEQGRVHVAPHLSSSDQAAPLPQPPLPCPCHDPAQGGPCLQVGPALLGERGHRCGPCGGSPPLLSVLLHHLLPLDRAPEIVPLTAAGSLCAPWTLPGGPGPWRPGSAVWPDLAGALHDQLLRLPFHFSWLEINMGRREKRKKKHRPHCQTAFSLNSPYYLINKWCGFASVVISLLTLVLHSTIHCFVHHVSKCKISYNNDHSCSR